MKNSQNFFTVNYFNLLIKILIYLLSSSVAFSNENKIGSITEVNGKIIVINDDLKERELLIHDQIFLNEEIFITKGSSATIQFIDNTAIIMKESTSLKVDVFKNLKQNPKFKAKLLKGKINIESGSIAKNNNGEMIIDVLKSSLELKGTRIEINLKPDGKSNISLAKDSFGNIGEININLDGQTSNITSSEQVFEVSVNNEILTRDKTNEEKETEKTVTQRLIKSSKINENEIIQQLQKKLDDGKLKDVNNDGIVNEEDIVSAKEQITEDKKQKIDFIVENTKDENTDFLSDVINQSDDKNTGEVIEKIINTQNNLVEGVVENLSDKDNKFLTTTTSEGAILIKEKIFETIVSKETKKTAEILSKVMAKSDDVTVSSVINNITEKNINTNSKLSLNVMADFSEKSPEKLKDLTQANKVKIGSLTKIAVQSADASKEDADLIAKIVSASSSKVVNNIMIEVSKSSTDDKQNLSAHVLNSIVDNNPDKIDIIIDDVKDIIFSQTIESAQNQLEGNSTTTEDITNSIAKIITKSDNKTGAKFLEKLEDASRESDSSLSLNVISNITKQDNYEKKIESLSATSSIVEQNITNLVEKAVETASSEEDIGLVTNIVEKSKGIITNKIVDSASKNKENKKKITEIIVKVIKKNPEKAVEIIEKNQDVKKVMDSIKSKIESKEAVTSEDFEDVFEADISPN